MSTAVVRGLTTVALLKVNYDANADHLDFYMPFVLDTLRAWSDDAFLAEDASAEIYGRHSLRLPVEAVRTLLTRVCKLGYLRREHGRFFRNPHKPVEDDFSSQRAAIEREHAAVAKRFVDFAQNHNLRIASEEEALAIILSFLESNDVAILLGSGVERISAAEEHESARELRTAARFIQEILTADPSLAEYIQRMLEGLVLQNALLLRNINLRRRQFKDLEVFFDTGFLFRAVGLSSGPYVAAAREALDMLRKAGARLAVFSNTIDEMRSVLAAIERRIGTSSGIQTLRSTELVRFFVSRRYQPSDVAKASALLERNIRQAGFTVRALPTRIPLYTLDEEDLARRLMRETKLI